MKNIINFENYSIPLSMGGQIKIPKELKFLGDTKPYIVYDKEYKTKKKSKKQSVSTVVDFNHFIQVTWLRISG